MIQKFKLGDLVILSNHSTASRKTNEKNLSNVMIVLHDNTRNNEKENPMILVLTSYGCDYIHSEYLELVQHV